AGSRATAADGSSGYPVVSADGHRVVFQSTAPDLVDGFSHGGAYRFTNVFLYSDDDGTISLVSHQSASSMTGGDGNSILDGVASISAAGAAVAFASPASNLVAGYQAGYSYPLNVFVYSRSDGGIALVSHRLGDALTGGNGYSTFAATSADGQTIAFTSTAQ